MSEALYRKYRPQVFGDVVGQEHIERTLKNAIEQDKVSHAYLFTGPRGTGKTTMARILAKALLCKKGPTVEPCGSCVECEAIAEGSHPDVYELDAASRTGVENVREEIISRVSYAPTRGAWKVYIIDEVHMLSTAAFNALLKTLEEPPGHVVFILCTTDPQKVPETIHSRCQRFDFHRISIESIVARLGTVCAKEGVDFEAEALELIAHRAEGGMRNALTSLEQLIAFGGGHATLEGAQNLLGSLDETDLSDIVVAIGQRDAAACFNWVARYVETGADLAQFVRDLSEHVRNLYLLTVAGLEVEIPVSDAARAAMADQLRYFGQDRLSRMLAVLDDVAKELRASSNPRLAFEIALTRMIRPESDLTLDALAERVEELEARLDALMKGSVRLPFSPEATAAGASATSVPASEVNAAVQPAPVQMPSAAVGQANPAPMGTAKTPSASQPQAAAPVQAASQAAPPAQTASQPSAPPASAPVDAAPVAAVERSSSQGAPAASAGEAAAATSPAPVASAQPAEQAPQRTTASPSVMTASIDLSNPAALQRFWHSVTSTLRKANPARGVLFMNARISAEPDAQGIVITFGNESGFAYNAAQKREVLDLLAQTIESVAGGAVPFRLVLAGGEAASAAASAAAPQRPAPQAAQRQAAPARAAAPAQAAPVAVSAPSAPPQAVPAARAATTPPASVTAPAPQQRPSASVTAPASAPAPSRSSASPAPRRPASTTPLPPDDDRVPLDVYESSIDASVVDDGGYEVSFAPAPAPTAPRPVAASQRPASAAPTAQARPAAVPQRPAIPVAADHPQARPAPSAPQAPSVQRDAAAPQPAAAPRAAVPQPAAAAGTPVAAQPATASVASPAAPAAAGDDSQRIVDILTESFGEGIKFEELPD